MKNNIVLLTAALFALLVPVAAMPQGDARPPVAVQAPTVKAAGAPGATGADDPTRFQFTVSAEGPASVGPVKAPVQVVSFVDYQCPYCNRFVPTQQRILDEYKDNVRLVVKQFPLPFHKGADLIAAAVLTAADEGKFWPMHKAVTERARDLVLPRAVKPEEMPAAIDGLKAKLVEIGGTAGVDTAKLKAALDTGTQQPAVESDFKQARTLGIMVTPTTFINGRYVRGAVPFAEFKAVIDEELQWAAKGKRPKFPPVAMVREVEKAPPAPAAPQAPGAPDANKRSVVDPGKSPGFGPKDAKVTVVTFLDYQ